MIPSDATGRLRVALVSSLAWSLTWSPPTASLATAARAETPAFDPVMVTPYFDAADGADLAVQAATRFRLQDWPTAARLFLDHLARPRPRHPKQASFLAAHALSRAGKFAEAAARFDALEKSWPLLADHHRLHAARAYLASRKHALALDRASRIAATSPLDGEARVTRAEALAALARHAAAVKEWTGYLDAYPRAWREAEARQRRAESTEALGSASWSAARAMYREVFIKFPTESWARRAEARLRAKEPASLALTGPEQLTRGLALFAEMRNPESEAALRAALAAGDLDAKQACTAAYHLAQSVFKARDRPRAAPLFDEAARACERGADPEGVDLHMKALYQGARCWASRGEAERAAETFARAEAAHPSHSYADDARLRQAEVLDAIAAKKTATPDAGAAPKDGGAAGPSGVPPPEERARALLADMVDRYPAGDVRGEALFRLFFGAWKRGQLDEARRWLDETLAKVPREEGWWEAGRTLYWQGRLADRDGRRDQARDFYARCAREYPLAYYALQALNRLREGWPDEATKLIAELRAADAKVDDAWRFAPRPLFGEPAFLRGVELARLGLGAEAKRELAGAGIRIPEKGARVAREAEELLWLAAVLYDRAGEYALSHRIPRHVLDDWSRAWPVGENRKRWRLAYPRGYGELIGVHARKNGQPEALQFAIVREESAFDPLTESFANAVGLTQLTAAPAKRWAQGLPHDRQALHDPAINVTIGARELGYLWSYYGRAAPLAIAAYNAGEGAVNRWVRAAPASQSLDEFLESIPYDETRGYTKRVLASWFAYQWLYGPAAEAVPSLPVALPRR